MPIELWEAVEFHRQGDFARAENECLRALAEDPARYEALHLQGLIRLKGGDPAAAANLIERAIALAPAEPTYCVSLAETFHARGQFDSCVAWLRLALSLAPDRAEIHCNLGATLVDQGMLDEAIVAFQTALTIQPDLVPAHNNLANVLQRQGLKEQALVHFREAIRLDPNAAEVRSNIAKLLMERGSLAEALTHAVAAVRLRPDFVGGLLNLGNVLVSMGRLDEAEVCLREALRISPDLARGHAALGGVLEQQGDLEGSMLAYRSALICDPHHAGTLGRLASRLRGKLPEADRALIENLLTDPQLPADSRRPLAFGLSQILDAEGAFDRASEFAKQANALQAAEFRARGRAYRPTDSAALVEQNEHVFTPEFFKLTSGFGLDTDRPVFVFGLPRSGTSLAEQILASHTSVFGGGELTLMNETAHALPLPGESLANRVQALDHRIVPHLAQEHLRKLDALAPDALRIVDKMPENYQHLGLIATLFPQAKLIHCRRDLRDVALSCWLTDFGQVRWASDLDHIVSHIHCYERWMNHWRQVLPTPILDIDYESVVTDLESSARKLIAWCNLPWDPACLTFHRTPRPVRTVSSAQVRRPIYSSSVARWKNYQHLLPQLFAGLEPIDPKA